MPATTESRARTRAFARVLGPFITLVPGIVAIRAADLGAISADFFFENPILVWFAGALLLMPGLIIIAFHQYWSSPPAVMISLFGWFLSLRGLALLAAPQLIEGGVGAAMNFIPLVQAGFGVLVLVGLWLTYAGWIAKYPPIPPAASL